MTFYDVKMLTKVNGLERVVLGTAAPLRPPSCSRSAARVVVFQRAKFLSALSFAIASSSAPSAFVPTMDGSSNTSTVSVANRVSTVTATAASSHQTQSTPPSSSSLAQPACLTITQVNLQAVQTPACLPGNSIQPPRRSAVSPGRRRLCTGGPSRAGSGPLPHTTLALPACQSLRRYSQTRPPGQMASDRRPVASSRPERQRRHRRWRVFSVVRARWRCHRFYSTRGSRHSSPILPSPSNPKGFPSLLAQPFLLGDPLPFSSAVGGGYLATVQAFWASLRPRPPLHHRPNNGTASESDINPRETGIKMFRMQWRNISFAFSGLTQSHVFERSMPQKWPSSHSSTESLFAGLPAISWDELSEKVEIGRGSFGAVCSAKRLNGDVVAVKKLIRDHERKKGLFLKEARILNSLSDEHIVQLKAVCSNPVAMMLEYLCFDFSPFNINWRITEARTEAGIRIVPVKFL